MLRIKPQRRPAVKDDGLLNHWEMIRLSKSWNQEELNRCIRASPGQSFLGSLFRSNRFIEEVLQDNIPENMTFDKLVSIYRSLQNKISKEVIIVMVKATK